MELPDNDSQVKTPTNIVDSFEQSKMSQGETVSQLEYNKYVHQSNDSNV